MGRRFLGRLSAYITLVTILAAFMFPDDGRCEPIRDKEKVLQTHQ